MKILALETSCDETSVAVVEDGNKVLSNVIASSIEAHQETKGVVPEVAARAQLEYFMPVLMEAMGNAQCSWDDIDLLAVTKGPGLVGSLLVGVTAANTLSVLHKKPLIGVHHIMGHVFSNWLRSERPVLPAVVLTVSGGHNDLVLVREDLSLEILGETLDDAAGEAFDKVAKMLGLGYPGGPEISKLAAKGERKEISFPRPMMDAKYGHNFSFSGLKTAVRYAIPKGYKKEDIAAGFEEAVCDTLITKLLRASKEYNAKELHLAGGVSASTRLREVLMERANGKKVRWPKKGEYCMDNAAMIGAAAYVLISSQLQTSSSGIRNQYPVSVNLDSHFVL